MSLGLEGKSMGRDRITVSAATGMTIAILGLGYLSFGVWTMLIFSSGFGVGLLLWLLFKRQPDFSQIKWPFIVAFVLFVVHRIEEYATSFFDELARLTGTPTPDIGSWQVVLLVLLSVGGWLAMPFLVIHRIAFGYYLAWTAFAAMGITELAHFLIFPFLTGERYGYFPGMASVIVLAPVAWWGMVRLASGARPEASRGSGNV